MMHLYRCALDWLRRRLFFESVETLSSFGAGTKDAHNGVESGVSPYLPPEPSKKGGMR